MSDLPETVCKVVDHSWEKSKVGIGYLVCSRCCMIKEKPKSTFNTLYGTPVIESEHIPEGKAYLVGGRVFKGKK